MRYDSTRARFPTDKGGIRAQFHHVIDIVPTILEATGIPRRPGICCGQRSRILQTHFTWELYDISKDWTQNNNLADSKPTRVKEMEELPWVAKYQVLPLDSSVSTRVVSPAPGPTAGRTTSTYLGETVTGIPRSVAPNLPNTSYTITAEATIP